MKAIILFLCSFYMPKLQENTLYIFCRGTATKSGFVAKQYNIIDTQITHTGIGYFKNGVARIYHVTDDKHVKNALQVSSMKSFAVPETIHLSIWEIPMERRAFNTTVAMLHRSATRKIIFDRQFSLTNSPDSIYCAEFCAIVLAEAGVFSVPRTIYLKDKLAASFLDRQLFTYFPADFFLQIPGIKKIFTWKKEHEPFPR